MALIVRAFPLKRSTEELNRFIAALQTERAADARAFYDDYGVAYESWHLQKTDHGAWIIAISVVDDPQRSAPRYAKATEPYAAWFKEQVLQLSGIDPATAPLGPDTQQVYEWVDRQRDRIQFVA